MSKRMITLNGATAFSAFGFSFNWDERQISSVYINNESTGTSDSLSLKLAGQPWTIRRLSFDSSAPGTPLSLTITDANDGVVGRRLDLVQLPSDGNVNITLHDTRIRYLSGGADSNVTLSLGSQQTKHVELYDARQSKVTLGDGAVQTLMLSQGNDTVTGGSGYVGFIDFDEGNNTFIGGSGYVGSIRSNGNNTFELKGGADSVSLGSGTSKVVVSGGFVGAITSFSGTNTVTIGAGGEVRSIGFSGGIDKVSVAGRVEQVSLGSNKDTLTITGNGRVNQADLGDGNNSFRMSGEQVNSVIAGAGWVDSLSTGEGNDTVTLAKGGVGTLRLGGGDDRVIVQAQDPANGLLLSGGQGVDTLDLSQFSKGVVITLNNLGAWQNPAAKNGNIDGAGKGYLAVTGFENVQGSAGADRIEGNELANRLTGGLGNDTLIGGAGNDTLLGGGGNDVFVFGVGSGTDRIEGFTAGADRIQIAGADSLTDLTFTSLGATETRIDMGAIHIVVTGLSLGQLQDAGNFMF